MFHVEQFLAFSNTCRDNGLLLTPQQLESLRLYVETLLEWNARVNLVSRKDAENIWASHILHSVSIFFGRVFPESLNVLDIGTGGGLPGVPLAIVKPGWSVTLMDSIGKKTAALQDIVDRIGIPGIDIVNGRAEDRAILEKRRGRYHMVVARGVAPLVNLAKWARPYLMKPASRVLQASVNAVPVPSLVAYKGGDLESELKELRVKVPGTKQDVGNLVFRGSAEAGIEGKKLVVIQFT
jgi:16S rRNA (guanine527-N7)-methyltransferase